MVDILSNEGFKITEKECCICYEKFIDNISFDELSKKYYKLFEKKYNTNEDDFFGENPVRCYKDRFECLICRYLVCDTCIQNIPDKDGGTGDYVRPFSCPMCRTIDLRYQIGGEYLPSELLYDLKKSKK